MRSWSTTSGMPPTSEATTAVENRETAREELCKQIALWRVALAFGYLFDLQDFLAALSNIEGRR